MEMLGFKVLSRGKISGFKVFMGNLMYFGNFEEGKMRGFQSFEGGNHPFTPHPLLGRLGENKMSIV